MTTVSRGRRDYSALKHLEFYCSLGPAGGKFGYLIEHSHFMGIVIRSHPYEEARPFQTSSALTAIAFELLLLLFSFLSCFASIFTDTDLFNLSKCMFLKFLASQSASRFKAASLHAARKPDLAATSTYHWTKPVIVVRGIATTCRRSTLDMNPTYTFRVCST